MLAYTNSERYTGDYTQFSYSEKQHTGLKKTKEEFMNVIGSRSRGAVTQLVFEYRLRQMQHLN